MSYWELVELNRKLGIPSVLSKAAEKELLADLAFAKGIINGFYWIIVG